MKRPSRVDLIAGPDPGVGAEHPGERRDEVVAGGADDEGRPPCVLVGVELVEHLRVDAGKDRCHHLGAHAVDLTAGTPVISSRATLSTSLVSSSVAPRSR